MPFKSGTPRLKSAGRKKGTPNKRTRELIEILDEKGFCPVREMIEVLLDAKTAYKQITPEAALACKVDPRPALMQIVSSNAEHIAHYVYPKRKAVDVNLFDEDGPINLNLTVGGVNEAKSGRQPEPAGADKPSA